MDKLKALLIDDERNALEAMAAMLGRYCPQVEVAASCRSADEAIVAIRQKRPDVLFLDIEMPGKNGFDLLEILDAPIPAVIFVTAFDHYAIDAIRQCAFDYLLKPVDEGELIRAVSRLQANRLRPAEEARADRLLERVRALDRGFRKVAIPTLDGFDFIPVQDVLYCVADGNYTDVVMISGKRHLVSRTLRDIAGMLGDPLFFRVHQSYLINLDHMIRYVRGSGGYVVMRDGTQIPVARSRKEELLWLIRQA